METRRTFLSGLLLVAYSGLGAQLVRAQNPVINPPSQRPTGRPDEPEVPPIAAPDKKILENNDKDMKKKVEQLYELAKQLKEQVENTDSSKVLSLNLMKKAEEIEKLAHDIKNRSKG
jgi:hypothetical protein